MPLTCPKSMPMPFPANTQLSNVTLDELPFESVTAPLNPENAVLVNTALTRPQLVHPVWMPLEVVAGEHGCAMQLLLIKVMLDVPLLAGRNDLDAGAVSHRIM